MGLHHLLEARPIGDGRYTVDNEGDPDRRDVVFGGQLLAQMIMTVGAEFPGKFARTISAVFARPGLISAPTELAVEKLHDGRSFGSATVTAWQGDRLISRGQLLMDAGDADVIRHCSPMPEVPGPADCVDAGQHAGLLFPGSELRTVGVVDTWSVDAPLAPAGIQQWLRTPDAPADDVLANQAILSWATDGFLIGAAMRPHEGMGQDRAHRDLSTGVVNHTLTFHEPFSCRDWILMACESTWAGYGRSYGRAGMFSESGQLVASYVQDNMIRSFEPTQSTSDGSHYRTKM